MNQLVQNVTRREHHRLALRATGIFTETLGSDNKLSRAQQQQQRQLYCTQQLSTIQISYPRCPALDGGVLFRITGQTTTTTTTDEILQSGLNRMQISSLVLNNDL
jgi:hypothetical protein